MVCTYAEHGRKITAQGPKTNELLQTHSEIDPVFVRKMASDRQIISCGANRISLRGQVLDNDVRPTDLKYFFFFFFTVRGFISVRVLRPSAIN